MTGRTSLILALLIAWPVSALAQPLWGELPVPGGVAAARLVFDLGLPGTRPDETWLLDLVQRHHAIGNDGAESLVRRYFDYLTLVTAETRACGPDGCVLPTAATPRAERDRTRRVLEVLGLRLRERDGTYLVEPSESDRDRQRHLWLRALGIETSALMETLAAGGSISIEIPESRVPLPLPDLWARVTARNRPLASEIARFSSNARLYAGLFALDDETLAFLGRQPALLDRLRADPAGTFAAFARSVRIQDGVVVTPGGSDATAIWHRLVNEGPTDPAAFVPRLLDVDDGRLAFFYDTVARLDPVRQAFVLGDHLPPDRRQIHARAVYRVFRDFEPHWDLSLQPFHWRSFDPAIVLGFVDVQPGGVVGPEWWPSLLSHASDVGWDDQPDRLQRDLAARPADAEWLLSWVFDTPAESRQRFAALRFLQRCFPTRTPDDALAIAVALRTLSEMPSLALSLERMGVTTPETYRLLGRAAHEATESGGQSDALAMLTRWQTALGLVEQLVRHHRLSADRRDDLLVSLADLVLEAPGEPHSAVADWVVDTLLPTVAQGQPNSPATEDTWHAAMLLGSRDPASGEVRWEGLPYRIDRAGHTLRAVQGIRASSPGPRLTDLIALRGIRRALEAGPETLHDVRDLADRLDGLAPAVASLPTENRREPDAVRRLRDATRALRSIAKPQDLNRAGRERSRLGELMTTIGDVVLPSWLYAVAVAPTSQPAQLFIDGWRRHRLGTDDGVDWQRMAWRSPVTEVDPAGGTFLRGSYLGLDVPLADAQLRAVPPDELLDPPALHAEDLRALIESLSLRVDPELTDDGTEIGSVVSALAAGRATLATWTTAPPHRAALRGQLEEAGVDPRRINLALWWRDTRPDAIATILGVSEVYWLGGGTTLPPAWGASSRAVDGCLCFRAVGPLDAAWFRGRAGSGLIGSAQSDLPLRLAEHLAAHELPASLIPLILPSATRDWTDRIWQFVPRDGDALAAFPRRLSWSRIEAYLLSLIAHGLLTSPTGPDDHR